MFSAEISYKNILSQHVYRVKKVPGNGNLLTFLALPFIAFMPNNLRVDGNFNYANDNVGGLNDNFIVSQTRVIKASSTNNKVSLTSAFKNYIKFTNDLEGAEAARFLFAVGQIEYILENHSGIARSLSREDHRALKDLREKRDGILYDDINAALDELRTNEQKIREIAEDHAGGSHKYKVVSRYAATFYERDWIKRISGDDLYKVYVEGQRNPNTLSGIPFVNRMPPYGVVLLTEAIRFSKWSAAGYFQMYQQGRMGAGLNATGSMRADFTQTFDNLVNEMSGEYALYGDVPGVVPPDSSQSQSASPVVSTQDQNQK